jgi:hypothetical protein
MVHKRGYLKHKNTDKFTPDELRKMLGVPRLRGTAVLVCPTGTSAAP